MVITATGRPRRFGASATTVDPDRVWELWTSPGTWGRWDGGLRDARLDPPFAPGAVGTITALDGWVSAFVVEEVVDRGTDRAAAGSERLRRCRVGVALPGARLVLTRTLTGSRLRHDVEFTGPLGPLWAQVLGRRFRLLLPPTVRALVDLAERAG